MDITHELKGERRSLDGSEGIGSAEGDSHSSGGSEHYGEEDCASSGIHSEGTFVHPVCEGRGWSYSQLCSFILFGKEGGDVIHRDGEFVHPVCEERH